uniref:Uncharacterized protein n=1 Tax=Kryptolebias marmoratus TaxID=37003 RepID=A0A3Q3B5G5_KRYMA
MSPMSCIGFLMLALSGQNLRPALTLCLCPPQMCDSSADGTIYKYHAKTLNGSHTVNFTDYTGKCVLFVNVATY